MLLNRSHHVLTHYNLSYTRPLRVCSLPLPQPLSYSSLKPTEYSLTPSLRLVSTESHLSLYSTYEVVGKVLTLDGGMGLGLRVLSATEWPKNADTGAVIDLKAYGAVIDATHRYKGIFYANESSGGEGG